MVSYRFLAAALCATIASANDIVPRQEGVSILSSVIPSATTSPYFVSSVSASLSMASVSASESMASKSASASMSSASAASASAAGSKGAAAMPTYDASMAAVLGLGGAALVNLIV